MIIEVELPHEIAGALSKLVDAAGAGSHPEFRAVARNQLVAEALTLWLQNAAVYEHGRGLTLNRARLKFDPLLDPALVPVRRD